MHFLCFLGPQCRLSDTNGSFHPFSTVHYTLCWQVVMQSTFCFPFSYIRTCIWALLFRFCFQIRKETIWHSFPLLPSLIALFPLKYPQAKKLLFSCYSFGNYVLKISRQQKSSSVSHMGTERGSWPSEKLIASLMPQPQYLHTVKVLITLFGS